MITREEAKKWNRLSTVFEHHIDKIYNSFEQHIKDLEAQLINTKQLTCDECAYDDSTYGCQCPFNCTRSLDDDTKDYYTPKDQQ